MALGHRDILDNHLTTIGTPDFVALTGVALTVAMALGKSPPMATFKMIVMLPCTAFAQVRGSISDAFGGRLGEGLRQWRSGGGSTAARIRGVRAACPCACPGAGQGHALAGVQVPQIGLERSDCRWSSSIRGTRGSALWCACMAYNTGLTKARSFSLGDRHLVGERGDQVGHLGGVGARHPVAGVEPVDA
jgi:hypothetical protein